MFACSYPAVFLIVNGLRSADKRRSLFRLLRRDKWDIVLLQETHHTHEAEGQAWAEEGPNGMIANWAGATYWSHGNSTSRGVAILIRPGADISEIALRHNSADGRTLSVDFTYTRAAFTAIYIYAPCTAADRSAYFTQSLLPTLPAQRQLLLGGDIMHSRSGRSRPSRPSGGTHSRLL